MKYVIGVNFSCTQVIAGLFDKNGIFVCKAAEKVSPYKTENESDSYEPEDWAQACFTAIRRVVEESHIDADDVVCIAAGGHNSEQVLLGADGKPVCRSLSGRRMKFPDEDRELEELSQLSAWTGNGVLKENVASKILWYKKREPQIFAKTKHILYGKDWLNYRLTGILATDVTVASYSQLFDVRNRCWSVSMLQWLGVSEDIMPKAYESDAVIGYLTSEAAAATGLSERVAVAAGQTNKACIELASRCVEEGDDIYTLSLSGNLIMHSGSFVDVSAYGMQIFCSGVHGEYMIQANTEGIAALQSYEKIFYPGQSGKGKEDPLLSLLEVKAASSETGAKGLLFVPELKQQYVPISDRSRGGLLAGLSGSTSENDLVQAIVEGICYASLDNINTVHEKTGIPKKEIHCRSMGNPDLWMQILANMVNHAVGYIRPENGTVNGNAVLAAVAAGLYPNATDAALTMKKADAVYRPEKMNVRFYEKGYVKYLNMREIV